MEILELKLLQNRENIQQKIENIEKEGSYLQEQSKALELSDLLNSMAIILIGDEKIQESLELLRRAETLSHNSTRHKSASFNTIATFYRRQGKIITSLKYIERSISVHPSGSAYLNLCSILNIQGKFEKSLEIAMHTIIFVQDEIIEENSDFQRVSSENSEILAVAFYNLAVQLEYLKRTDEAASYYRKAVEFSSKYLPENNCIREILKQIYEKVVAGQSKMMEIRNKTEGKSTQVGQNAHAQHAPNIKKRVIIKNNRSKSPAPKSPLAAKEPSEKKLNRNPTSHRKFVKVGITKAKFMENYAAVSAKGDESEENCKSTSRSMKFEKNHSEISFKSKIEGDGFKKKEAPKAEKGKKVMKFQRVLSEKIKKDEDLGKAGKEKTDEEGKKPLVIPTPSIHSVEPTEVVQNERKKELEVLSRENSFGNISENEEFQPKTDFFNGPNLSPVPKNYSVDMEKFLIATGENFNEIDLNDEEKKNQSIIDASIKSDSHKNSSYHSMISVKEENFIKNDSIKSESRKSASNHSLVSIKEEKKSIKNDSIKSESRKNSSNHSLNSEKLPKNESSLKSHLEISSPQETSREKNESVEENIEKASHSEKSLVEEKYLDEDSESEKFSRRSRRSSNERPKKGASNERLSFSSHNEDNQDQSIELPVKNDKKTEEELFTPEEKMHRKNSNSLEEEDEKVSNKKSKKNQEKVEKLNEKNSESEQSDMEIEKFNKGDILNDSDEDFEKNSEKDMLQMTAERSMRFVVRSTKSNKDSFFDSFHLPKKVNNSHAHLTNHL